MTRLTQLSAIGLEVSDISAWERFAARVLGLEVSPAGSDESRFLRMDEYHHRIAIRSGERDDLNFAAWEVADEATLRGLVDRLQSRGFAVNWGSADEARARRVTHVAVVTDPNGVANELRVGSLRERERPFRSPRPIGGFVAGRLGFGHIVLSVDDLDESLRFYCDGLGLRLSDYIDLDLGPSTTTRVAFLRAGPRHHSLAIGEFSAKQRLHHFMLQARDIDDVGRTYDLCADEGVPVASTLGRHTNDEMFSFYMRSPSGFQVEFGHGGIEIDDNAWEVRLHHAPSVWGHRPV